MSSHLELRRSLASYALGALEPAERAEVDAHLAGCADCRDELDSFAALPGLLSRLDLTETQAGSPSATLLPRVLAAVERERAGRVRQVSRWRLATATIATAALVAGVLSVVGGAASPAPPELTLTAAKGVSATGSVTLRSRPWGTELRLRLRALPAADGYRAYAVDRSGARTLAASWGPTPTGRAEVPGSTSLDSAQLSGLVIATAEGAELLSVTAGRRP